MSQLEQILTEVAGLSPEQIQQALQLAQEKDWSLLRSVESIEGVSIPKVVAAFAKYYGCKSANLDVMDLPKAIIKLIDRELAMELRIVPIDRAGNNLIIAMGDPKNTAIVAKIRQKTGYLVKPVLASEEQISKSIEIYYGEALEIDDYSETALSGAMPTMHSSDLQRLEIGGKKSPNDGPIINLVNKILTLCVDKGASDIHIEAYESEMRVRLRIDGSLVVIAKPPTIFKDSLISRIKIMAGINIAEKRLPQDGGIRVTSGGRPIDFRVNTLPTIFGEKIVLRILDKSNLQVDMTELGFERRDLARFQDAIHKPFGMVLVTGPTGSGKTTTLYSALAELNKTSENIMTAEDPVEYNLEGINQVQVRADIGLDFASALRAFLRQDPDIIMVGEIRDLTTASIAVKAALTGHMVLSTLHTNSAADTIVRMLNMGIETFNLVAALNAIVAQRLARKICDKCRIIDTSVTPEIMIQMGIPPQYAHREDIHAYVGKGCEACTNKGNRGRIGVHEVLVTNDAIRDAIILGRPAGEIKKIAMASGMQTLRQCALSKMVQGLISAKEVIKNTMSDSDGESDSAAA